MSNLAQHTVAVTDAMFGARKPTAITTADTLELAKNLEKSLNHLTKIHDDAFGNLAESMVLISDIITNLEGHQIEIGCGVK